MKRNLNRNALASFATGMALMVALTALVHPAAAFSGCVAYDRVGVAVFGQQKVSTGDRYIAPNGQSVPSAITYTDAAGGKTNYLSVWQISELLDVDIAWNAVTGKVKIAPLPTDSVEITRGTPDLPYSVTPVYGKTIGLFTEVDPARWRIGLHLLPTTQPKVKSPCLTRI